MEKSIVVIAFLVSCALTACASAPPSVASANADGEKAALIRTDTEFSKAAATSGIAAAFFEYAAEEATILPMNANAITGSEAIRAHYAETPAGAVLDWKPLKADVSRSGDLGYTVGSYEFRAPGPDGKSVARYGKYCPIWKKQLDGSWKFVVDVGNPSPPPK